MKSSWEEITVDGSTMRVFISLPDGSDPAPGVAVIQHQDGVDPFTQEMTRRMAAAGYAAAAPDLYHRDGVDCRDDGPTRRGRLRDTKVIEDVNASLQFLEQQESVISDRLGIIGFCMGGRVAYLMAAANAELKAAVDYYGGNVFKSWGEGPSPFDRTAEIHCPILGEFGLDDVNPSPDDVRKLDAELTRHGKVYAFHSYENTGHGFMNKDNPQHYRAHADQASWPRTLEFFEKYLR